jgi:tetratricopeptide (TPR) repeat protein
MDRGAARNRLALQGLHGSVKLLQREAALTVLGLRRSLMAMTARRISIHALSLALLVAALAACAGRSAPVTTPRLFEEMGPHERRVTTRSAQAQDYFDQGLNWAYAFNHDEAIRSFRHAASLDPGCAMAWWGIAYCNGPHINYPLMDETRSRDAWEALQKATALREQVTPVERALIEALARRYADPAAGKLPLTFEERAPLDRAYADAMAEVDRQFPDDSDVLALYAESLMDLRPWDLWDKTTGAPRPETPTVLAVLERALALAPDHPGANHFYLHAVEASPHPDKADAAADRLRNLVRASGHLVHMPSHIDVRTGRWAQAAEQNRQASAVDTRYRELSPRQDFYRLYMAHDDHFLAYACMMLGRREEGLEAARAMSRKMPADWLRKNAPFADAYLPIEVEVLVRFGMWEEILSHPRPAEDLPVTTAFWRFARAGALAATGKLPAAEREQVKFREHVATIPESTMMAMNPARRVLSIADLVLEGEIAYRKGEIDRAVAKLGEAAAIEDTLNYIEPPDWVQPVRHSLGAILLDAKRYEEAEEVYRTDLTRWPENGWALYGLARSLQARDRPEAAAVQARFERAWSHADTQIRATCLCVASSQ